MNEKLLNTLKTYLEMPSCDGNKERQNLRKELAILIEKEYNIKTHSIKKG